VITVGLGLPVLAAAGAEGGGVYRIVIDGPISPATADYIESVLDLAAENEALGLVVQLDTPGGLLDSTRSIVKNLLAAPIPVIVYVAPSGASATSAGVFVTLAAHVAAMAPGTTIGAAHPVTGQGGDIEGEMGKKVENFAAAFGESIAERRGRNVEWAERAVRESVSITEVEAAATNVVDLVAGSIDELLTRCQGRVVQVGSAERTLDFSSAKTATGQVVIVDVPMTLRQRVLSVITHPNIAYLLMMAGMLGLYMEFSNPGVVFPGVVGAICLLLALLAMQVLPVNSTAVLLILLGMAFLLAELFMPSFGVLGLGGLLALTLGSLFLYTRESQLAVDPSLVMATLAMFGLALALVAFVLVRDRRRRSVTGAEGLVGEAGFTVGTVHGSGKVKVHGEIWNAVSNVPIEPGRPVVVEAVEGLRVRVREQRE
jgi:membrane-bound serine protease (ClpP class)